MGVAMNDLIDRLRVSAEPVGKLLLEAADALQNAQARIAELTETLRAMVEIGNSQRSREFADVKKTLTKARELLSAGSVVPPGPAMPGMAAHAEAAPAEIAPAAQPEETKGREEEIVSGMYKEIQNLLRYSA
jgi:pyruvate/2-oxoglutarate dehydrogenase complex dihydrolipoamide acyltransferase (E2) component